jgi:sporulation protein YlmC with PRC-barrel domain
MALLPIKLNRNEPSVQGARFTLRVYEFLDRLLDDVTNIKTTVTINGNYLAQVVELDVTDSPYTATDVSGTFIVDASGGNVTINLPTVAINNLFVIKKKDTSGNTVTVSSGDDIDGTGTAVLTVPYESITVVGDTVTYNII